MVPLLCFNADEFAAVYPFGDGDASGVVFFWADGDGGVSGDTVMCFGLLEGFYEVVYSHGRSSVFSVM